MKHKAEKEKPRIASPSCLSPHLEKRKIASEHTKGGGDGTVRRGAEVTYGDGVGPSQAERKRRDRGGKIDTSPASRGGATAYLSTGRGWRVWDDHMHRTHGAKAGLVLQGVGVGAPIDVVAVTITASVTMDRI